MLITTRLATALTSVLSDYAGLLEAFNENVPDNGAGDLTEDASAVEGRAALAAFAEHEAATRWDVDPERSVLIDAIEKADDEEAARDARDELARLDAARLPAAGAPLTTEQTLAGLRRMADQHAAGTAPRALLDAAMLLIKPASRD